MDGFLGKNPTKTFFFVNFGFGPDVVLINGLIGLVFGIPSKVKSIST